VNDDLVVEKFLQQFGARGLPAMMDSTICCVIGSDQPDPKLCLEIGAAVLLDKPLILCLPRGRSISFNLRAAATAIIETEPDGSLTEIQKQEFDRAVTRVLKHDPRAKQEE
jgi:hypothetical protein